MIVVVGGSGLLGRLVVADLLVRGEQVRVVARDSAAARAVVGPDVDVVAADLRRPETLGAAVEGAGAVVAAAHGFLGGRGAGPVEVDGNGNAALAAAARAVDAEVVLVSVLGASGDSPVELFRAKHAAETAVRDSGAGWTIVRSPAFVETWVRIIRDTAKGSGRPLVFGRGEQPMAFVCAGDVADVVVRAVLDPALRGQVLAVSGERLTMNELVGAVEKADGLIKEPRHIPRTMLRLMASAAKPVKPGFARQNATALAMDTLELGDGDVGLRARLELPRARTVHEVLHA